jgi:ATP phosphoribosyltransferase regulatory subunit
MIHQPPAGARDLLPLEVAQKSWINDRLQEVFARWGYHRIVTSTLEWLDTLMAGGAIDSAKVIQLKASFEGNLGLRPELTASIARAVVTRMTENHFPQRLCYRANVFRNPPVGYHGRQLEFYQAGVELLFAGGVLADAEILLLLIDAIDSLGISNWHLILGEAQLTQDLLKPFPEKLKDQVRHCLANLDRVTLENLPLEPELQKRALFLFDLRGNPQEILAQVSQLDLEPATATIVNNLKSLIQVLTESHPKTLPLTLDLSLVQTFDYYTGIVFEVVNLEENQARTLGQGGRYDQLLGLYHPQKQSSPGIGFSLNIEDLHSCLLNTPQLPKNSPNSDWLIIPQEPQSTAAAFIYAQKLRQSHHLVRVEIDLGGRSPQEIRDYARNSRITYLAWIDCQGNPNVEVVK